MGDTDKICTRCKILISNADGRFRIPDIGEFHPACWDATRRERIPESSNWPLLVALEAWLIKDLEQFVRACDLLGQGWEDDPRSALTHARRGAATLSRRPLLPVLNPDTT